MITNFITDVILVLQGYPKVLLIMAIISAFASISLFNLYKQVCPKAYQAIKKTMERLGASAKYSIFR